MQQQLIHVCLKHQNAVSLNRLNLQSSEGVKRQSNDAFKWQAASASLRLGREELPE